MAGQKMAGHLLGQGQVPADIPGFPGGRCSRAQIQGLIGDDVEMLGQFGIKEGQVVVAGHVQTPPLLDGPTHSLGEAL